MTMKYMLREELQKMNLEPELTEALCALFEKVNKLAQEEQRLRQMEGIKKAKEQGKALGRPKITEPEDFLAITKAWERKEVSAPEAARLCKMGVSTFYRRVRYLKDKNIHQERR